MTPAEILDEMANTFRERGKLYGDNYKRLGAVMEALFPDGVFLRDAQDFLQWHLFEMMVMKLTRLAVTHMSHEDSAHDLGVYAAMFISIQKEVNRENKTGHLTANK